MKIIKNRAGKVVEYSFARGEVTNTNTEHNERDFALLFKRCEYLEATRPESSDYYDAMDMLDDAMMR